MKHGKAKPGGKIEQKHQQSPLLPDSLLWLDESALHESGSPKPSLRQELALAKLHLEALRQDIVENREQLHSRPRPVGEGQRQLACVERCPGEVFFILLTLLAPL